MIIKQKLFIFGGVQSLAGSPCEMYDPVTSVWSEIPSPVAPRCLASAVSFKGQIFIAGNFRGDYERNQMPLQVYDIDENKWEPIMIFSKFYRLSLLRISRDVLAKCMVVAH